MKQSDLITGPPVPLCGPGVARRPLVVDMKNCRSAKVVDVEVLGGA